MTIGDAPGALTQEDGAPETTRERKAHPAPALERLRLDGRVALVTGGSQGLGRAMARALAEAGAEVALAARRVAGREEARRDLAATGRDALGPADRPGQRRRRDGGGGCDWWTTSAGWTSW